MDPSTTKSLLEIFNEAAEIADASARAGFLAGACAGNAELQRRLEALLIADSDAGTIGESAGKESRLDLTLPATIDRYRLIEKLGEGGWGTVYLAEQQEPIRRRVALKLIKPGMDTRQVIGRFEAERQALALMDHSNIAKVLDAGTSESGRPYFVMEFVAGVKITEYCDQQRLDPRQRIELVTVLCDAVQHAHQKGVIHRDLKPSNILVADVNGKATPKIIDFGIAKAVEGRLTEETLSTAMEQFLGTPAYMSPEQASGGGTDVDTRSDIYSLGVILYELLTGRTPFDQKELLKDGVDAMRRTIREQAPPLPSTKLSTLAASELATIAQARQSEPPRLRWMLRGDLEWIVMKCLEKERSRRYATASGMGSDLRRYLGHEAVLARPPSATYRLQTWVRRNRTLSAAACAVFVSLVIGLVTATWALSRERAARSLLARRAYVSETLLAGQALDVHDLGRARDLLRHHVPKSGEHDLRNWEWRYLAGRCAGDEHVALAGHSGAISNVRFLQENMLLTTGLNDFRAIIWNVNEGRAISVVTNKHFGGGINSPMALASRRGRLFYRPSWSSLPGLVAVDLASGNQTALLKDRGVIPSLDVSPNDDVLAIGYGDRMELLDLDGNPGVGALATISGGVRDLCFSHDGAWLVIEDNSGEIEFWNVREQRKTGVITNSVRTGNARLALSSDDRWLAVCGGAGLTEVWVWNVQSRSLVTNWNDTAEVVCAAFSPDGKWLATGGGDSTVRLWNTATWRKSRILSGHNDVVSAMDFSPDSQSLITGTGGGELFRWPLGEAQVEPDTGLLPAAEWYEVARDGSGFARALHLPMTNGFVRAIGTEVWSSAPLRCAGRVKTEDLELSCGAVVLPGGRKLALGCRDGSIRLRGPNEDEIVATHAHPTEVVSIDVTLDGSTLASLSYKDIRLWRLPDLRLIGTPFGSSGVLSVKLSEDSKYLAGFTGAGDMLIWNLSSGEHSAPWHTFAVMRNLSAAAFSPDSRCVAAVAGGDMGFIWTRTTQTRTSLPRVLAEYTSLSYSHDGTRLVAGSVGDAGIFDAGTGETVLALNQRGLKLAFLADGERLLAVGSQGARVLRAPPLKSFQSVGWLREQPSLEPPEYVGPRPAGVLFAEPRRK